MSELCTPKVATEAGFAPRSATSMTKKIKIGEVARHFDVSVDLLRLYEREGLLIPIKSSKGTRYFTENDFPWIATLLRLVREAGLNFAGVRHLLALLPCWNIRGCGEVRTHECSVVAHGAEPCWIKQNCCNPGNCYSCSVYRSACRCENLKAVIVNGLA